MPAPNSNGVITPEMRSILFYTVIAIYMALTILTIISLFFNVTDLKEKYENQLFIVFIIEVGVVVFAVFRQVFILPNNPENIRIYVSPNVDGFDRKDKYLASYETTNEDDGKKQLFTGIETHRAPDGGIEFTLKHVTKEMFVSFEIMNLQRTKTWKSYHFKAGTMRFDSLNQ